ncbi:VOC family protein [Amycolatopsis sp. FDAARGOS 1241]|uniref:VOC family protein n=1 Tax=Amycolatopsis sp. FDAARGOS 1241 TaxID=2778070 RepID=UPI00194DB1F2|nr:VOC family protein [Amycolatopsis sp. FDAARGOS 1241]QRP48349.1 VOC family protein [Amycolatopsis sp. FDAARGOS 1241]
MDVLSSRVLIHPRDLEVSTAFYRDTLGLAIQREFPGGTVFFAGGGSIEVVGSDDDAPSTAVDLWLQVRDLAATLEELAARGVTPVRGAKREPWGLDEAWLTDPDGLRIVLVEVPPEHPLRRDPR